MGVVVMLSPIPGSILRDTVVLKVPTGVDRYQQTTYKSYTVHHVHMQADNHTKKGPGNTEVSLIGTLYVDARRSMPRLDWEALQEAAQAAGAQMTLEVINRAGKRSGPYTVEIVDGLPDDEDHLHHWEIGVS
jgi:hypothetical protein